MNIKVITNNDEIINKYDYVWIDGNYRDVLIKVRDMVYKGHRLLTSPLPASIRGMYSPVRSIVISKEKNKLFDIEAKMIGESIIKYDAILGERRIDFDNLKSYKMMDLELLKSAIKELNKNIY